MIGWDSLLWLLASWTVLSVVTSLAMAQWLVEPARPLPRQPVAEWQAREAS